MANVWSVLTTIAMFLIVTVVVFYALASYTWTAVHRGGPGVEVGVFYVALCVVPPLLGVVAALAVRRAAPKKPQHHTARPGV